MVNIASDSCTIIRDGGEVQQYSTNPNKLTEPDIIFYWEIILLVLHLGLAGTSIILQRLQKEVNNIFMAEIFFIQVVLHL